MDSTVTSAQVLEDKLYQLNTDTYEGLIHTHTLRLKMKDTILMRDSHPSGAEQASPSTGPPGSPYPASAISPADSES